MIKKLLLLTLLLGNLFYVSAQSEDSVYKNSIYFKGWLSEYRKYPTKLLLDSLHNDTILLQLLDSTTKYQALYSKYPIVQSLTGVIGLLSWIHSFPPPIILGSIYLLFERKNIIQKRHDYFYYRKKLLKHMGVDMLKVDSKISGYEKLEIKFREKSYDKLNKRLKKKSR